MSLSYHGPGLDSPLCELATVLGAMSAARTGAGALIVVSGEPGIGKRLRRSIRSRLCTASDGVRSSHKTCPTSTRQRPWPLPPTWAIRLRFVPWRSPRLDSVVTEIGATPERPHRCQSPPITMCKATEFLPPRIQHVEHRSTFVELLSNTECNPRNPPQFGIGCRNGS